MARNIRNLVLLILICLILVSCEYPGDDVMYSIGKYRSFEWYSEGTFQDYTDYGKFYYDSVDFTKNRYFQKIETSDITILNEHLDDFDNWVELFRKEDPCQELGLNYDFDRSVIDCEDYLYMESELHTWSDGHMTFLKYDIYFFDTQSGFSQKILCNGHSSI